MTKTISILIFALAFASVFSAQAQPSTYVLTEAETQQWAQLGQIEKNATTAYDQAILRAVNTPVGDSSKEVHSAVQSGWLAVGMIKAQKGEFLARLQAAHECKGCQIVDGKLQ
jgi:hypothetical protein